MKKIITILFCLICIGVSAQNKSKSVYTVAGGNVEVYDSANNKWIRKTKDSSIKGNDWIRAKSNFTLRDKKGFSEPYSQCDCTLVANLKPMTMVTAVKRDNDVITRDIATSSYMLDSYSLKLKPGENWDFGIIITAKDKNATDYLVTTDNDWIIIDNPSGKVDGKVKITGRISLDGLLSENNLQGSCKVVCNGITSTVNFTVANN